MEQEKISVIKLLTTMKAYYNRANLIRDEETYYNPYPNTYHAKHKLIYCKPKEKINPMSRSGCIGCGSNCDSEAYINFDGQDFQELDKYFNHSANKFLKLLEEWPRKERFPMIDDKEKVRSVARNLMGTEEHSNFVHTYNSWINIPKKERINEIKKIKSQQKEANSLEKRLNEINILLDTSTRIYNLEINY